MSTSVTTPDGKWSIVLNPATLNPATLVQATLNPASIVQASLTPASVSIVAVPPSPPPANQAPIFNIIKKIDMIGNAPNPWQGNWDKGTPGSASGTFTKNATAPDGTPGCALLQFVTGGKGGMIYHGLAVTGGAHVYNRFIYRKREMKTDPLGWSSIACIETDLEITNPTTGIPYDMALQQNNNDQQIDISILHKWTGQGVKANPTLRKANVWYETEEYWGFDPTTNAITCFGVMEDGVYYPINKTVQNPDGSAWGKDEINVQCQYDSNEVASTNHTIYLSMLEIDLGVAA